MRQNMTLPVEGETFQYNTVNPFDAGKRKVRRFSRTFYSFLPTERWVQNRWIFCDIFICSKDTQQFRFLGFLTVHIYLKIYFYENYAAKSSFYAEFRSAGVFEISFTIQKISMKAFNFF